MAGTTGGWTTNSGGGDLRGGSCCDHRPAYYDDHFGLAASCERGYCLDERYQGQWAAAASRLGYEPAACRRGYQFFLAAVAEQSAGDDRHARRTDKNGATAYPYQRRGDDRDCPSIHR